LTAAEKELIKKYPVAAAHIFMNSKTALNKASYTFPGKGLNDKTDAFRHAFWCALNVVTIGVGENLTKLFTDAHETEVPQKWQLEKQMDLYNNSVGIDYGKTITWKTSVQTIIDALKLKVLTGVMYYLDPIDYDDPLFWPDPNVAGSGTHGIKTGGSNPTVIKPTNQ
jgi:hypothetical protein